MFMAGSFIFSVSSSPARVASCDSAEAPLLCRVHHWVRATHHAQDVRGITPTRYGWAAERTTSKPYRQWIARQWYLRWKAVSSKPILPWMQSPGWLSIALCIHGTEGPWTNPNYGGMGEMFRFQQAYGAEFWRAKGTADHWTPTEQLIAAYRGWKDGGGWGGWSAHAKCGV